MPTKSPRPNYNGPASSRGGAGRSADGILPELRPIAGQDGKPGHHDFLPNFPRHDSARGVADQPPAGRLSVEKCGRFDQHGDWPLHHSGGNARSDLRRRCSVCLRDQTDDDPDLVQPLGEPGRAVSAGRSRVLHRAQVLASDPVFVGVARHHPLGPSRASCEQSEYIDKNYGGGLLIWDHLFGSYQAEQPNIAIRYGLAHPRSAPDNPFVVAYEELWLTLKAAMRAGTLRQRLAILSGPP